jgi:nitrogen fixation/metabolism regulation signal transduction histidine kinase
MLTYKRKGSGKTFEHLYDQLARINQHIQKIKIDLYNQEAFNKLIISQVDIGIIVIDQHGSVKLFNEAALDLLDLKVFTNLRQLNKIQEDLKELIVYMEPGSSKTIKLIINDKTRQILFRVNFYKRQDEFFKLISFQDIKRELDINEMESWQKLIRILTHEITNSIGPINSTIDTISGFFVDDKTSVIRTADRVDQKTIDNTVKGIGIIKERSEGLLDFVQQFRDLTLIPKPKFTKISLMDMFTGLQLLFQEDLKRKDINLSTDLYPQNLLLLADRSLIDQVLINLFRNAIEAGGKTINLKARAEDGGRVVIRVKDDGRGIDGETIENIFVPFYTTKTDGSGIGLSLSREIMRMHNGTISVISSPGKGSEFEMVFG